MKCTCFVKNKDEAPCREARQQEKLGGYGVDVVENPILSGTGEHVSFCKGHDCYYILSYHREGAISLYESTDLVNWTTKQQQINHMLGAQHITSLTLRYHQDQYYLLYALEEYYFLTCTKQLSDSWQTPYALCQTNQALSLFLDENQLYLLIERSSSPDNFRSLELQQLDLQTYEFIKQPMCLYYYESETPLQNCQLIKREGYYYLSFTIMGDQTVQDVLLRSQTLSKGYRKHPQTALMCSPLDNHLNRVGYGKLFESFEGHWYFIHQCQRPLPCEKHVHFPLGFELALQNIVWESEWPYLRGFRTTAYDQVFLYLEKIKHKRSRINYVIGDARFQTDFHCQTVREAGVLQLEEDELVVNPHANQFKQLLFRHQEDFQFEFGFKMNHEPHQNEQQAGLIYRYDDHNFHYVYSTYNEKAQQKVLNVASVQDGKRVIHLDEGICYEGEVEIWLRTTGEKATFYFQNRIGSFERIGPTLDICQLLTGSSAKALSMGMYTEDTETKPKTRFRDIFYVRRPFKS